MDSYSYFYGAWIEGPSSARQQDDWHKAQPHAEKPLRPSKDGA